LPDHIYNRIHCICIYPSRSPYLGAILTRLLKFVNYLSAAEFFTINSSAFNASS
jgi:GDP-D-mannose dehydratase